MLSALENLEDKVSLFRRSEVGGETEIITIERGKCREGVVSVSLWGHWMQLAPVWLESQIPASLFRVLWFGPCLCYSLPCTPVVLDASLSPECSAAFYDLSLHTLLKYLFLFVAQHTISAQLFKYQLKWYFLPA